MGKELEALNKIQHDFGQLKGQELVSCYETIFNALKRLESIDNANPSEALENIGNIDLGDNPYKTFEHNKLKNVYSADFNAIKQALLKAQEQEQYYFDLIQLLKENNMDYYMLKEMFKQQEPKQYIKWEDLEFKEMYKIIPVRMGDNVYQMAYCLYENEGYIRLEDCQRIYLELFANEKKFFNDLHLERVEE